MAVGIQVRLCFALYLADDHREQERRRHVRSLPYTISVEVSAPVSSAPILSERAPSISSSSEWTPLVGSLILQKRNQGKDPLLRVLYGDRPSCYCCTWCREIPERCELCMQPQLTT